MAKSEEIAELAKALTKTQSVLKGAKKDSTNPFFKSKYADLESVWDAIREPLAANGLAVSQLIDESDKGPVLVTTLMHESGEWIEGRAPIISKENTPQGFGSAITYQRRYGLAAIVGVVQVDDDAEAAQRPPAGPHPGTERPVPPLAHYREAALSPMPYADTPPIPGTIEASPQGDAYVFKSLKKFAGRRIDSIPMGELKSYIDWFEKNGKNISPPIMEELEIIKAHLNVNDTIPF